MTIVMSKKMVLVLAATVCGTGSLVARTGSEDGESAWENGLPYKYELNVGWGGFPVVDALTFSWFDLWETREELIWYPNSLGDIYSGYTGPSYSTGVISAEFNMQFKKWFALGVQANFDAIWSTVHSSDTGERIGSANGLVFALLPYARFTYLNRPVVKLYSAVGLGVTAGYRNYSAEGYSAYASAYPAFQLTPIGIMLGRRVYGLFELGVGTVYMGCRAGIGYRF